MSWKKLQRREVAASLPNTPPKGSHISHTLYKLLLHVCVYVLGDDVMVILCIGNAPKVLGSRVPLPQENVPGRDHTRAVLHQRERDPESGALRENTPHLHPGGGQGLDPEIDHTDAHAHAVPREGNLVSAVQQGNVPPLPRDGGQGLAPLMGVVGRGLVVQGGADIAHALPNHRGEGLMCTYGGVL